MINGWIAVLWVVSILIAIVFAVLVWRFIVNVPSLLSDIRDELRKKNELYAMKNGLQYEDNQDSDD